MTLEKVKDKVLLAKIKHSDREAFVKAYDLYVEDIYRFIYFKVGSKEEAEDLTSAAFLKTWGYLQNNSLTDYKTLKSLFYKIARNLIIDHYRKNNHWNKVSINDGKIPDITDEKQDMARQVELALDLVVIETKLTKLKDEYQEVIIMRYINELSIKEIAEILDKPKSNIRVLIYRAINALKELIESDKS